MQRYFLRRAIMSGKGDNVTNGNRYNSGDWPTDYNYVTKKQKVGKSFWITIAAAVLFGLVCAFLAFLFVSPVGKQWREGRHVEPVVSSISADKDYEGILRSSGYAYCPEWYALNPMYNSRGDLIFDVSDQDASKAFAQAIYGEILDLITAYTADSNESGYLSVYLYPEKRMIQIWTNRVNEQLIDKERAWMLGRQFKLFCMFDACAQDVTVEVVFLNQSSGKTVAVMSF